MQATAAYIGNEQHLDIPAPEKETREPQDVFSRYLPLLYRTAYRYLGNAADAEDAVQDALLSAYKHLDSVQRAGANVDVARCHRQQLCSDAVAEKATADSRVAPRAIRGQAGIYGIRAVGALRTES